MTNKEVQTETVSTDKLSTDAEGNKANPALNGGVPISRYVETDALKEAGTSAHANLEGAEQLKERIQEVVNTDKALAGVSHRLSEELWDAVATELTVATVKLRSLKSTDDRSALLEQIQQLNGKLSTLLVTFIA